MFSFLKKKSSPNTPPEEQDVIPGPDSNNTNSDGDGFVVIDNQNPPMNNLYPPIPPAAGGIHGIPIPPVHKVTPIHYLQGVPFKISPELEDSNSFDVTQQEIDGILAIMTKRLQFEEDYDFSLEREIVNQ